MTYNRVVGSRSITGKSREFGFNPIEGGNGVGCNSKSDNGIYESIERLRWT